MHQVWWCMRVLRIEVAGKGADACFVTRLRGTSKVALLLIAALVAGLSSGRTIAEFSGTTANSGNTFSAAASFGTASEVNAVVAKDGAVAASYAQTVQADAPVAYWRFGEPVGSATVVDLGGNGHHGTVPTTNPPDLNMPGLVGDGNAAIRWRQNGSPVSVPHAPALQLNGSFSIELWVNAEDHQTPHAERWLLDKGGNPDVNGWRIGYDDTKTLRLRRNGVATSSAPGMLGSLAVPRHLVVTYDGANVRWYVDGALSTTTAVTFPASSGTAAVTFGGNWTSTDQTKIDEPALYATALTHERVNVHYKVGKSLGTDVCAGYRVHANITDAGSPATGVTSATANVSSMTSGATAVPLTAGSYTVGGVNYSYRSGPLRVGVVEGSYGYSVTWVDAGGPHTRAGLATTVSKAIPIAVQWLTGMEAGTSGDDSMYKESNSGTTRSTSAHSGAFSRRITKGVSNDFVGKDGFTATTTLSLALRLVSSPAADVTSLVAFTNSTTPLYVGYQVASKRLTLRWGTNTAAVAASEVVAGTWYTIDLRVDVSANPNTAAWRIDAVDQPAVSVAALAQTVTTVRFGSAVATDAYTAEFDDVVHSRALLDYPIGPVRVLPARADGMGNSVGVSNFDHGDGSVISSSSFDRLDDPIMTSIGDSVRQVTASATSYLEFTIGNTTEVCVQGVQATILLTKPASQANNVKLSVFVGANERVVTSGDINNNMSYRSATVAPVSTWSPTELNGLLFRFGYSTDISPTPNLHAFLLEYATSG